MQIDNDHYSLCPIHERHAWRLCDFVVSNAERLRDYFPKTLEANLTPTLAQYFVEQKVKEFKNREEFLFVLRENSTRTIVGLFYVKALDREKGQAELAYCVGYQYAGKGLTSAFLAKLIIWCFEVLPLDTLRIIVHESNRASIRIAEKNGFVYSGVLPREHQTADGRWLDMQLYELKKEL